MGAEVYGEKTKTGGINAAGLCLILALLLSGCGEEKAQTPKMSAEGTDTVQSSTPGESRPANDNTSGSQGTDSDFYSAATNFSKSDVESFAEQVREQFLNRDWEALAEKIAYPIAIDATICQNREEFISIVSDEEELSPYFFVELEEESCQEMFCSWQGLMLGMTGRVWIAEVLGQDLSSQGLKIIAVNGLTNSFGSLPGQVNMSVVEGSVTPVSISLLLENETDLEIVYGEDYRLQKEENGQVTDLMPLSPWAFPDAVYKPKRGEPVLWSADWSGLYGELEPGNYRIVKRVLDLPRASDLGSSERSLGFTVTAAP